MTLRLPLFLVFEGIDGSGKSTLSSMVHRHYLDRGVPAVRLAEPTGGEWGGRIRELLQSGSAPPPEEQLRLFILDRDQDVRFNIRPALEKGEMIILDRYYYSNAAYQGAAGLDADRIIDENRKRGFPGPDRVYLVDLPPRTALERVRGRGGADAFESEPFLEKVRERYLHLRNGKFLVLDGEKAPDALAREIIEDIETQFGSP